MHADVLIYCLYSPIGRRTGEPTSDCSVPCLDARCFLPTSTTAVADGLCHKLQKARLCVSGKKLLQNVMQAGYRAANKGSPQEEESRSTSNWPEGSRWQWGGAACAGSGKMARMVSASGTPTEPTCVRSHHLSQSDRAPHAQASCHSRLPWQPVCLSWTAPQNTQ